MPKTHKITANPSSPHFCSKVDPTLRSTFVSTTPPCVYRVGKMEAADVDSEKNGKDLNVLPVEEQSGAVKPKGFWSQFRYYEELLDRKLGVESHSVDRVLPEDRQAPNSVVMGFMWASATMNLSCFSTGFLGYEFGLSLSETIPITIFATLLGSAITVRQTLRRRGQSACAGIC